jgi:hypothetical protein
MLRQYGYRDGYPLRGQLMCITSGTDKKSGYLTEADVAIALTRLFEYLDYQKSAK